MKKDNTWLLVEIFITLLFLITSIEFAILKNSEKEPFVKNVEYKKYGNFTFISNDLYSLSIKTNDIKKSTCDYCLYALTTSVTTRGEEGTYTIDEYKIYYNNVEEMKDIIQFSEDEVVDVVSLDEIEINNKTFYYSNFDDNIYLVYSTEKHDLKLFIIVEFVKSTTYDKYHRVDKEILNPNIDINILNSNEIQNGLLFNLIKLV